MENQMDIENSFPQTISLAGTTFENRQENIRKFARYGARFTLHREPTNKYDKNAIKVRANGRDIGYIPKTKNEFLCKIMDAGIPLKANFVMRNVSAKHENQGVRIKISLVKSD